MNMHRYINQLKFDAQKLMVQDQKAKVKHGNLYLGTFDNIDLLDETLRGEYVAR